MRASSVSISSCGCGGRAIVAVVASSTQTRVRHYRRTPSADRTHNERIADRQNAFRWGGVHVYRPHQHFTYDPTSWNHELQKDVFEKQRRERNLSSTSSQPSGPLSMSERLRMLQEREEEVQRNRIAIHQHQKQEEEEKLPSLGVEEVEQQEAELKSGDSTKDKDSEDAPDFFFDVQDTAKVETTREDAEVALPSFQFLIDSLTEARERAYSPRYRRNRVTSHTRRYVLRYTDLLKLAIAKLEAAEVGETCSLDAAVCLWVHVLLGVERLAVEAEEEKEETQTGAQLLTSLHALLVRTILDECVREGYLTADMRPQQKNQQPPVLFSSYLANSSSAENSTNANVKRDTGTPTAEMLVELLYILTHPLARNATQLPNNHVRDAESYVHQLNDLVVSVRDRTRGSVRSRIERSDFSPSGDGERNHTQEEEEEEEQQREGVGITEYLDPEHLRYYATCLTRLSSEDGLTRAPEWILLLTLSRSEAAHLVRLAKSTVVEGAAASVRAVLTNGSRNVSSSPSSSSTPTSTRNPGGIHPPQLSESEVRSMVLVCASLLNDGLLAKSRDDAPSSRTTLTLSMSITSHTLEILSYTPNYDIHVASLLRLACAWMRCARSVPALKQLYQESLVKQQMALALLLSRIRFDVDADGEDVEQKENERRLVADLFCELCVSAFIAPVPQRITRKQRSEETEKEEVEEEEEEKMRRLATLPVFREWKRLRGQTVRRLLKTLSIEELESIRSESFDGVSIPSFVAVDEKKEGNENALRSLSWTDLLAFGQYRATGGLSLELWEKAYEWSTLARQNDEKERRRSALALLLLRGRCKRVGSSVSQQKREEQHEFQEQFLEYGGEEEDEHGQRIHSLSKQRQNHHHQHKCAIPCDAACADRIATLVAALLVDPSGDEEEFQKALRNGDTNAWGSALESLQSVEAEMTELHAFNTPTSMRLMMTSGDTGGEWEDVIEVIRSACDVVIARQKERTSGKVMRF